MSSHAASAEMNDNLAVDGYPTYHTGNAEDAYIDGYDPVSLGASHSSLLKTSTWLGMGLFMVSLAGFGTALFGFARSLWGTGLAAENNGLYTWGGLAFGVIVLLIALILMTVVGRKDYKSYRARTGRMN